MPATVTNIAHYRATHPPFVRLWNAHWRMIGAWYGLSMKLGMAITGRTIPRKPE